ncbi:uncharacterized protein G2W53_023891 [Senna tora]|uniref:Uncharacterized protein n=1 Tax=Senna tora TaxID=362788 RepID=A0A834WGG0_9FABA|nr:uncharacterized protein G2W53_023891 [Senna tora]
MGLLMHASVYHIHDQKAHVVG